MGITLIESLTAAASVGMGCGTCCGSGISTALYAYITTHIKSMKQSFRAFLDFFLGKIIAVIVLCCIASVIGRNIIDESGSVFGIKSAFIVDTLMLAMGVWFLIGWIREYRGHKGCKTCGGCSHEDKEPQEVKSTSRAALFGMGVGYGISPCAPLIIMTGYAATLPLGNAAVLGGVFALASTVSPMLFVLLISGFIAGKMYKEIPQYITWFRLVCYVVLIALFSFELIKEAGVL